MKLRFQRKYLCIPYWLFLILFVLIPILLIVFYAFTDPMGNFTWDAVVNFFSSTNKLNLLLISLLFGVMNTIVCLLIGYPIAYILAKKEYNANYIIVMLFVMPMWINFVLRTGATRDVLSWIGLDGGEHPYFATMVGLVYNYLPFVILPLYSTMLKLDKQQVEAALDLGCNRVQVFTKSILPQTVPGIVSAAMMVFMPTMSSQVIPEVLSEHKLMLFGNSIYLSFTNGQTGDGSLMALVMLLIVGISMLVTRNFSEKDNGRVSQW